MNETTTMKIATPHPQSPSMSFLLCRDRLPWGASPRVIKLEQHHLDLTENKVGY
jgi:hypothetical protein